MSGRLGALVGFTGDEGQIGDAAVPWRFDSLDVDYRRLRDEAGVLDLSGVGLVAVCGSGAESVLDEVFARDISYMTPERTVMGLLVADDGKPVDVVTVYRTEDDFLLLTSVGRRTDVLSFLRGHAGDRATVSDVTDQRAVIGIEGARSIDLLSEILPEPVEGLPFQAVRTIEWLGGDVIVSRTGVTGEFGFTFLAGWEAAADMWKVLTAVARPSGWEAIEVAMLEVRQPMLHRELFDDDTVVSAGLNWLVDAEKAQLAGVEQIRAQAADEERRRVCVTSDRPLPRRARVILDGDAVGEVVYTLYSPGLARHCGVVRVQCDVAVAGINVEVEVDGGMASATTVSSPMRIPTSWTKLLG